MQTDTAKNFLTESQLHRLAADYAAVKQEIAVDQEQWLVFYLGKELFSLSMDELDEIAKVNSGIAIPSVNRHVLGLINVRGEPVILVDMAKVMGLRTSLEATDKQCVLILKDSENQLAGFLIDGVVKITEIANWQTQGDLAHKDTQSRFVDALSEYQGAGVSRLNANELIMCIGE